MVILAASVALIAVIVFPWGSLQDHSHWGNVRWIPFVSPPTPRLDMLANMALFAPLGAAAALSFRRGLAAAGLLAVTLSVLAELGQVYSHGRIPSGTDVVCNVLGAVGAAVVVQRRVGRKTE